MQPSPLRSKYTPAENISEKTKELKEEKKAFERISCEIP